MKIERMNKGSWGKVRAFFDLTTQEGFTMKGFKLIEGINGLFVSMPSQKGNDDEYYDTIWVESKQLRDDLNTMAINQYNDTASSMPNNQSANTEPSMESVSEPDSTGENITSEVSSQPEDTNNSFSDDDIPF